MDDKETTLTAPAPRLQEGMVIDGFLLKQKLHMGGMATLWDVVRVDGQPGPGDGEGPLIMKIPRIKGGEDPATIVGFEVEQMVMPMLKGPHVPRFIAKGDFIRQPYIVMEHIPGVSLRPRLDEAPLPADDVASIGARVAVALHALHKQHVVHLDIKPSNILFRPDGTVVLVDFGLSRHDQLPDLLEEEFSLPMGTGPYISPEQVQFVRNDPRSDLFALGVMLYHLSTGQRPFGQPNTVSGLRKRLYTDPVPPRAIKPDLPPWLQEVILRCLEVDPDKRYQSAAQIAQDLQHPDQIALTPRADRLGTSGKLKTLSRWFKAMGNEPKVETTTVGHVERCPIIMVAIGVKTGTPELDQKLLSTVRRILQIEPGARLACVSIMKTNRIGMDTLTDEQGNSLHVQQLVAIKHWARPLQQDLKLDEQRLTFHVLEAPDTAAAIVDFANRNQVDHIVMGARGNSALRRYLGSVSAQVVAEAECSVTVVRV
ncbi:serine/threonine protein kinase [Aquabacterium olei]|uniref:Serine/threonine protein kinase n=1 Tax=Aquabacterium olei TaxID=1296669 RepID=A0A2U8FQD4_9BURK|nr:bifunctional serine/threonine-protein kinase/universal stress protein [Aquabacterium olei]AWI53058.1 serine/threonine protein kinase [Aquabacterium olei]